LHATRTKHRPLPALTVVSIQTVSNQNT